MWKASHIVLSFISLSCSEKKNLTSDQIVHGPDCAITAWPNPGCQLLPGPSETAGLDSESWSYAQNPDPYPLGERGCLGVGLAMATVSPGMCLTPLRL